jgi:Na+-translocating ferredoxin:NAD+ oxidoreductase RNF subunit RnfB
MEQYFHSVRIAGESCKGRMACMKVCPTQAIRVRHGRAEILEDRCIDCGECARVCPNSAIVPQTSSFTDFSRFKYVVALPSPVLYGQFRKNILPANILAGLKRIGFDDACDVAAASGAVSVAIDEYLSTYRGPLPLLSPFCPTVVRLIQARYPNLIDLLIPIDSPMEIAAREVRKRKMKELGLRREEIGVIYVTPCPPKMVAIKYPPRKRTAHIDGAIAISDIYHPLLAAIADMNSDLREGQEPVRGIGLGWPVLGGQVLSLRAESCLAVGGLSDVGRILEEIENGKLGDIQYVEFHACPQGCCGGSLTVDNAYVARSKILSLVARFGVAASEDRERIRELRHKRYFSLPGTIPSRPFAPLDEDISRAIEKRKRIQGIFETLPQIDCGACGAPTCLSFAEDVVLERARREECPVMTARQVDSETSRISGLAPDSPLGVARGQHAEDETL